ncbi:MAG: DUF4382 domain-containing protein [bacterium]
MKLSRFSGGAPLMIALALLTGCSSNTARPSMGAVRVSMSDAPAEIDAIELVITEISIQRSGNDSLSGWEVLRSDSLRIDLLELRNGVFTAVAEEQVPAGGYHQLRLEIGAGSTIVVDGVTHPLEVPSGAQSGLKINGDFGVPAGGTLEIGVDFDAARSIVRTGAGRYQLKPVLRALPRANTGAISGTLTPSGVAAAVHALAGPDTVTSTLAAASGEFVLSLLPVGTYTVAIAPDSGYRDTTRAGVAVAAGSTTSLGTIALTPQ